MVHHVFSVDIFFFFHNFVILLAKLIPPSQASYVRLLLPFLVQFKVHNRKHKIKFQISVYISLALFPMNSRAGSTGLLCFYHLHEDWYLQPGSKEYPHFYLEIYI